MLQRAFSTGHVAKTALRQLVKQRIAAMSGEEQRNEAALVCAQLLREEAVVRAGRVALYAAMEGRELDLAAAAAALERQGKQVLLPRLRPDGEMDFAAAEAGERHAMGFRQPGPAAAAAVPEVVVCPGRAFDAAGHRVGWGRGYYDRALRLLPGVPTIGVCFACQVFEEVPHEPHDQPMDRVLHKHLLA